MLSIKYTYLFGASLFLIPWILICIARKDLRRLSIQVGLLFTVLGLITGYFWLTKDWWKPYTITNTVVGVEDIILGFGSGGLAACLYLSLFKKKLVESTKVDKNKRIFLLGLIIAFNLALFAFLFNLNITSFLSASIIMISASGMLLIWKRELILPALINGALMTILVVPIYLIMMFLTPTVIERTWLVDNLSGICLLKVPIEDYIFFFLSGLFCFGVYPFYTDSKLEKL